IENNSPCFTINADNTTITAATLGTATCVPTGGSNGISVAATLTNITIERFEIDGSGESTGDGINVGGGATNLIIRDMFIHDLDGDGVELADAQSGYARLRGNLFMNNAGLGVNNKRSVAVDAKYNAWGDVSGPHGANGDGVSSYVSYDPWTHVDLYLESSGTTNPDEVDSLGQITYTVYANLKNVTGAEFTLKYPKPHLTYLTSETFGTFDSEALNEDDGTLTFVAGNADSAESGTAVALFSVTFEAGETAGTYLLDLDEETDVFTMASPDGLSENIYATKLEDRNVVVKEGEEEGYKYFLPLILN
ncbi:MAG: hypothetical protein SVP52_09350, partial [Chloroflexota bacterium]|nr:hypothetical protein [Chloroflexota bacterium]